MKEFPKCPVETTLLLISDKWKVLIIRDLLPGKKRFGELKKINRNDFSKSINFKPSGNGGEWID